jgi:hypothetical protein
MRAITPADDINMPESSSVGHSDHFITLYTLPCQQILILKERKKKDPRRKIGTEGF